MYRFNFLTVCACVASKFEATANTFQNIILSSVDVYTCTCYLEMDLHRSIPFKMTVRTMTYKSTASPHIIKSSAEQYALENFSTTDLLLNDDENTVVIYCCMVVSMSVSFRSLISPPGPKLSSTTLFTHHHYQAPTHTSQFQRKS